MTKSKILLATALATLLVAPFAGCNGTSLDDGDSADVVLQIGTIQPTPITSTPSTADPTTCTFTITDWTINLANKPKNADAMTSPFNDIVLESMTISYQWFDPAFVTDPWTFPIGGTVPANGTFSLRFQPIALDALMGDMAGSTAALAMVLRGRTVSGDAVTSNAGGTMSVNSCQLQPVTGACCVGGTCSLVTEADCFAGGGLYLGDGTTCALNPCGGP